jgi:uncharacterized protein YbcI
MRNKSKGQIELEISEAVTKFTIKHIGKGPEEVRSYILEDTIVIRLRGALTTLEGQLIEKPEGINLVKSIRIYIFEKSRNILQRLLRRLINVSIIGFYIDINPQQKEMFIVLSLDKNIVSKFLKSKA